MRPLPALLQIFVVLAIASILSDYRALKAAISTYIEYSSILDDFVAVPGCNSSSPRFDAAKVSSLLSHIRTNEEVFMTDTRNDTETIETLSEDASSLRFRNHTNEASTMNATEEVTITIALKDSEAVNSTTADDRPTGLRLVLIGDSITRYQYLSLAYFLRHAKWFDPEQKPSLVNQRHYLRKAPAHQGWATFFRETNRILSPLERCDCFRDKWTHVKHVDGSVMENRYFHDPERNNMLTYLQAYGNTISVMHGRILPEEAFRDINATEYQHVNSTWQWQYSDWGEALEQYVACINATHVMMNAGFWPNDFRNNKEARDSIVRALKKTGLVGIWRGNTYLTSHEMKPSGAVTDKAMTDLFGDNVLNVSWSRGLQTKYFWDDKHFLEPVYRVMNEELLAMVGHTFSPEYEKQSVADLQEPNVKMRF